LGANRDVVHGDVMHTTAHIDSCSVGWNGLRSDEIPSNRAEEVPCKAGLALLRVVTVP